MSQPTGRRAHLFGMITTAASRHYTPVALRSFFTCTPLGDRDHLLLIDNDGDFALPEDVPADRITLVRPHKPQGFARNANTCLAEARTRKADLFLLNNDLIFTTGWLDPLLADRRALLSPMSNAQITRSAGSWLTQPAMTLSDYAGHEGDIEEIARQQANECQGYRAVASLAFFCIKIPRTVYEKVGRFDERFGKGGGEDRDYAIRAWLNGIPQEYALGSYVLHFQGKSTWHGAETPDEQAQRDAIYTEAFRKKWGPALTYAFLGGDWNLFRTDAALAQLLDASDFSAMVSRLRSTRSLDRYITRQQNATFAAVCCIYDDDSWLAAAVESVYGACTTIWFLVGERPWNGEATDQAPLLERIASLPDAAHKIRIVRGNWPDEASQRNAGLALVREAGDDYCLVLDADEIYDADQLAQAVTLVRENPQIDCWRASCFTYWKSYRYRVDPPEAVTAPIVVRSGTGRFVENRMYEAPAHANLPLETLAFHHMSYARTDEQIRRKITTFGHARDVVPGWFENVWLRWNVDRTIRDLNPCWPGAYQRIVEQPYELLPASLRRAWDADERQAS
jgi:GT2 family glycosyltransferase